MTGDVARQALALCSRYLDQAAAIVPQIGQGNYLAEAVGVYTEVRQEASDRIEGVRAYVNGLAATVPGGADQLEADWNPRIATAIKQSQGALEQMHDVNADLAPNFLADAQEFLDDVESAPQRFEDAIQGVVSGVTDTAGKAVSGVIGAVWPLLAVAAVAAAVYVVVLVKR